MLREVGAGGFSRRTFPIADCTALEIMFWTVPARVIPAGYPVPLPLVRGRIRTGSTRAAGRPRGEPNPKLLRPAYATAHELSGPGGVAQDCRLVGSGAEELSTVARIWRSAPGDAGQRGPPPNDSRSPGDALVPTSRRCRDQRSAPGSRARFPASFVEERNSIE